MIGQEPKESAADASNSSMHSFLAVDNGYECVSRHVPTVWHAGDWTGPVALQPDMERSAETSNGKQIEDIVALSAEGVKVIMLNMKDLYQILKTGSKLFRKYLALKEKQDAEEAALKAEILRNEIHETRNEIGETHFDGGLGDRANLAVEQAHDDWYAHDSVLDVLMCNSALARLTAHQKRHLESLAEGPRFFEPGEHLWRVGETIDYAFLIVAGTASFSSKADHESSCSSNRRESLSMVSHVHEALLV